MIRRLWCFLGGLVILLLIAAGPDRLFGASEYDRLMSRVAADPSEPEPTEEDLALHESLFIADLHADTQKWERDLLDRSLVGYADLLRLVEVNVALQSFTRVTQSPLPSGRELYQGTEPCCRQRSYKSFTDL